MRTATKQTFSFLTLFSALLILSACGRDVYPVMPPAGGYGYCGGVPCQGQPQPYPQPYPMQPGMGGMYGGYGGVYGGGGWGTGGSVNWSGRNGGGSVNWGRW